MVQFFLEKSQEVQRQRLLKHRLHQELKSKIAKASQEKPKDGVQELLQEGHTQHYSTFDREHGWKISKDDDRKQVLEDEKSNLAAENLAFTQQEQATLQVQYEDVIVKDVEEDDESEQSEFDSRKTNETEATGSTNKVGCIHGKWTP